MASLGIGLLGYGGIGKVHTLAYRSIPSIYPELPSYHLQAVCTTSPATAAAAARDGGFARSYTAVEDLVADPAVAVVDCALPNAAHKTALLAALSAGKHVYCEKPLALDAGEAREIARIAASSRGRVGMTFNYRFIPAVMRAKELCEERALGEIYGFRFEYLHTGYQDPARPLSWRMDRERAGGGALVDLGSHVIDLARHLLGEIEATLAVTKTYVSERPVAKGSALKGRVTVDDAAWLQALLASGAHGTIEVSRFATGAADDLRFRIEGSRGALRFDLMDSNWLYYYDGSHPQGVSGWTRLETVQSYPGAAVPPARSPGGWARSHVESQYRFLKAVLAGEKPSPGVEDGLAVELVIEAAYASAERGGWVPVGRA